MKNSCFILTKIRKIAVFAITLVFVLAASLFICQQKVNGQSVDSIATVKANVKLMQVERSVQTEKISEIKKVNEMQLEKRIYIENDSLILVPVLENATIKENDEIIFEKNIEKATNKID